MAENAPFCTKKIKNFSDLRGAPCAQQVLFLYPHFSNKSYAPAIASVVSIVLWVWTPLVPSSMGAFTPHVAAIN